MIRLMDAVLAAFGILILLPLLAILLLVGFLDTGSPIFRQARIGQNQQPFTIFKLRTMHPNTHSVPSHLADKTAVTHLGYFLRRTKLDELPQLWNVLEGNMSFVGPRPGLTNQIDLTDAREALGVFDVRPGITGLAQISGIDMSTPQLLAETDARMIKEMSLYNYFRYITLTITGKGSGDRIRS